MMIARIESLIMEKGLNDALKRAEVFKSWVRYDFDT